MKENNETTRMKHEMKQKRERKKETKNKERRTKNIPKQFKGKRTYMHEGKTKQNTN